MKRHSVDEAEPMHSIDSLFEPDDSPTVTHTSPSRADSLPRRWLKLSKDCLKVHQLPSEHSYPLLDSLLGPAKLNGLRWSHILFSLMAYLELKPASRSKYSAATARLSQIIQTAPPDRGTVGNLPYGPRLKAIDLTGHILTLQAADKLLVAFANLRGSLAFQCYEPLCLASCGLLETYCMEPQPDGKVFFRENHWEYARDQHGNLMSQYMKAEVGYCYRTCWEFGLGHRRGRGDSRAVVRVPCPGTAGSRAGLEPARSGPIVQVQGISGQIT